MRELKFRAWDKVCGCYVSSMWCLYSNGSISVDGVWASGDIELEQYTGLHDANGVEIYEGDIVEFIGGNSPIRQVVEFATKDINRTYGHGHCGEDKFSGFIISGYCGDRFLVIGNIHQNSELVNT